MQNVCKRAGLLIGWQNGSRLALVAWANCKSWSCTACSQRMAEHWGLRAAIGCRDIIGRGEPLDFVTITSHEKLQDFASTEKVWKVAWNSLYCAIKRQTPELMYMIVPEKHQDGRMHVHALWNAGVSKKWLKDNARKRGLGYQCEVKHVSEGSYASRYVVKYVGKSLGDTVPDHFRRVRVSQNWADIEKPNTGVGQVRWEHITSNAALMSVYEECQAKHITLIDQKTGEIFDDVDLSTMSYA